MHQQREDLDILFRKTAPEMVLQHIRKFGTMQSESLFEVGLENYPQRVYEHYAPSNLPEYTPDELEIRYKALIAKRNSGMLFDVLVDYTKNIIKLNGVEPICSLDKILNWNSITKRLGQNLFITAWLAFQDVEKGRSTDWSFAWSPIIKTDDKKLNQLFVRGIAENHFHLNGSTQVFSLSWACLMNHPQYISNFIKKAGDFEENLSVGIQRGSMDNVMPWKERLQYASMIRACLTRRCLGELTSHELWLEFLEFDGALEKSEIYGKIEVLRWCNGVRFPQPNGGKKCLDYANCEGLYRVDSQAVNRLEAGERAFMYHCFRMIFSKMFTLQEATLFYFYLLIKSNFASELIQNNGRPGFKNFEDYQDRKNGFYGLLEEYEAEAYRLAVRGSVEENNLVSLEARIMPKRNPHAMHTTIKRIDWLVKCSSEDKKELPYYYVVHFPKKQFSKKEFCKYPQIIRPRNDLTRKVAKRSALMLKQYMQKKEAILSNEKNHGQRILGIDACSREIGCRPETFATEFCYLRECSKNIECVEWYQEPRQDYKSLGITYHVGEDFMDVIDGLRAIDEAILFLEMEKGERLGHAIALGVDAQAYYAHKRWSIFLTKQDCLDNLMWILYRSLEWNISIDANYRSFLMEYARELLLYIYGGANGILPDEVKNQPSEIMDIYYYSWKLRRDHPDLYITGSFQEDDKQLIENYKCYKKGDSSLNKYRNMKSVAFFTYMYHFDVDVKDRGLEPEALKWEDWNWYIDLVSKFQEQLRRVVAERGISIECNPTSNVLISTFGTYDMHPILKFNRYLLEQSNNLPNIQVAINTDDLGVFDTSIENEYALLLCALRKMRHAEGNYNDEAIYDYLEHLRENGISMAFST